MGEQPVVERVSGGPVVADTFAGRIHVEWDNSATVTPLGQLPFFIEYLKQGSLFDGFVADCPLHYRSPNAPAKRDVLGTVLLSIHGEAALRASGRSGDSYNPHKRGRPSHSYHCYMMANLRLVLAVEVAPGNQHTSKHSSPRLWEFLDGLAADLRPWLIRGDVGFGNEPVMRLAEQRRQPYLFKLRLTKGVKCVIARAMGEQDWQDAGARWQGKDGQLRLEGWSRHRRIVILRRRTERSLALTERDAGGQLRLGFAEIDDGAEVWEYAVLVTSLDSEILSLGQLYRDRADCENSFDELKNQWGWGGLPPARCAPRRGAHTGIRRGCDPYGTRPNRHLAG